MKGSFKSDRALTRKKRTLALVAAIMLAMPVQVYASESAGSLDEVIQQAETQQQVQEQVQESTNTQQTAPQQENTDQSSTLNGGSNLPVTSSEFMDNMSGSLNMIGEEAEELSPLRSALQRVGRVIVQALILVITFYLPIRVLVDLVYILIPPLQGILSNGKTGQVIQSGSQQNQANGMGMGMNSGYSGMGMNSGYGMSGYGMSGGYGMRGNNMGMQQGGVAPGFCLVSQAALNAVATEQAGPGKVVAALRCYFKDSVVTVILAMLMLILFGSGILQNLGIALGDMLVNGIANLVSGL